MCKIQRYRYTCGHSSTHRHSQCRATYIPRKRAKISSSLAACHAQPYLVLCSKWKCGPCQSEQFNEDWMKRIEKAREEFQAALKRIAPHLVEEWGGYDLRSLPCSAERDELERLERVVDELEEERGLAGWTMRERFPNMCREPYERSKCSEKVLKPSLLRYEVKPEEVVEKTKVLFGGEKFVPRKHFTFHSFFKEEYSIVGPYVDYDDLAEQTMELSAWGLFWGEAMSGVAYGPKAKVDPKANANFVAKGPRAKSKEFSKATSPPMKQNPTSPKANKRTFFESAIESDVSDAESSTATSSRRQSKQPLRRVDSFFDETSPPPPV
ncbi:hypothetical protein M501DRAFT_597113 [Patellaria atrata CBS 101060]|uniref:Uncharacterized protein n=1 Tax=Patellaria atrata CBS 101060 TaxID=1346257 RepID=A0A9P4S3A5_9PEZI|nr:hypothetical protein M501DRAFT_597113 [Patellaria atrata CBS 101060]